jgi:hypothetical protein
LALTQDFFWSSGPAADDEAVGPTVDTWRCVLSIRPYKVKTALRITK